MRTFVRVSMIILLLTAALKLISVFSSESNFLVIPDRVISFLQIRHVLFIGAALEFGCIAYILHSRADERRLLALAWISSLFAAYRISAWLSGWTFQEPCHCLGYWLPIKPYVVGNISIGLLAFLFFGSIFWLWRIHLNSRKQI
jgi:hypothetical protein